MARFIDEVLTQGSSCCCHCCLLQGTEALSVVSMWFDDLVYTPVILGPVLRKKLLRGQMSSDVAHLHSPAQWT